MSLLISSVCWVRKGKLSAFPRKALDEDEGAATSSELAMMAASVLGVPAPGDDAVMVDDDEDEGAAAAAAAAAGEKGKRKKKAMVEGDSDNEEEEEGKEEEGEKKEEDEEDEDARIEKEFHMEHYDEEELRPTFTMEPFYKDQSEDPYLKREDGMDADDVDSEAEEDAVLEDDLFLLAAATEAEDNFSHLDAHIYEERDRNLFCHHDYLLPAFPLAIAYLDTELPSRAAGRPGVLAVPHKNLVAVGTMETAIELWDLDIIDSVECVATLGGPVDSDEANGLLVGKDGKKGKKKRKGTAGAGAAAAPVLKPGSHTDSVIALGANPVRTNVLASGSADRTVKIWDVATLSLVSTFDRVHGDKVQALEWCPSDPAVLLTAGFDRRVCAVDVRAAPSAPPVLAWTLADADPESVAWLPWRNGQFLVSQENGVVRCFDALRAMPPAQNTAPLWTLAAHEKAASALAVNAGIPGFVATGGLDKTLKLWNIADAPSLLFSRNVNASVYCAAFNRDNSTLLGFGTSHSVRVWDVSELRAVRSAFANVHSVAPPPVHDGEPAPVAPDSDGLVEVRPPGQEAGDDASAKKKKKKNPLAGVLPPALLNAMPRSAPHKKRFTKTRFTTKSIGK